MHQLELARKLALDRTGEYYLAQGNTRCPNRSELADGLKRLQDRHRPEIWLPTTTMGEIRIQVTDVSVPQGGMLAYRQTILFGGRITQVKLKAIKHLEGSAIAGWLDFHSAPYGAFSVDYVETRPDVTIETIESLTDVNWSKHVMLHETHDVYEKHLTLLNLTDDTVLSVSEWIKLPMWLGTKQRHIMFFKGLWDIRFPDLRNRTPPVPVWGWVSPDQLLVCLKLEDQQT